MTSRTTLNEIPSMQVEKPAASAIQRLVSLDRFRGITIAAMILVNNAGDEPSAYWPLQHAKWNGWTPTDLVFPFFLFIVGVAMAFSFTSRLKRGESRGRILGHVLWRGLVLFAIGVFLHGFPVRFLSPHLRIYGVLQRIAICYVLTAILVLWSEWRVQLGVALACLGGYWLLMRYMPVPGFGVPGHDVPFLDPDRNIVAWLDRKLMMGRLYEVTRDPEGVLSTIPALATCIAGLLTGKWLRTNRSLHTKALGLVVVGVLLVALGRTWNLWFPINKKLWTSSFVIFTAGMALIFLALCYWISDIRGHRGLWTKAILVFGKNSIAVYVFAEALSSTLSAIMVHTSAGVRTNLEDYLYSRVFVPLASPANASLLYALTYVLICWLAMLVLHRRGIFLKV